MKQNKEEYSRLGNCGFMDMILETGKKWIWRLLSFGHDNDVWLQRQLRQFINVKEILDYVGIIKDDE